MSKDTKQSSVGKGWDIASQRGTQKGELKRGNSKGELKRGNSKRGTEKSNLQKT